MGQWSFWREDNSAGILDSLINSISTTPDEFGNRLGYGIKNTDNISGDFDFVGHNGSAPGYRSVMFYNQARKMTIVVLTNFAGAVPTILQQHFTKHCPILFVATRTKKKIKSLFATRAMFCVWIAKQRKLL